MKRARYRLYYCGYLQQQVEWPIIHLNRDQTHYLTKVLRLKKAHSVEIFDDTRQSFLCDLINIQRNSTQLRFNRLIGTKLSPQKAHLHLAIAHIKADRFDWAVQKATELGVHTITPINSHYSQAHTAPSKAKIEHWQNIAINACRQSQRNDIPTIKAACHLAQSLALSSQNKHHSMALDITGSNLIPMANDEYPTYTLYIGPEGGWSQQDLELLTQHQIPLWRLGPLTLRTETAAITALGLLQYQLNQHQCSS